jgi:hypothetical protein
MPRRGSTLPPIPARACCRVSRPARGGMRLIVGPEFANSTTPPRASRSHWIQRRPDVYLGWPRERAATVNTALQGGNHGHERGAPAAPAPAGPKKPYSRPELTVHGTIEDLTRGVGPKGIVDAAGISLI